MSQDTGYNSSFEALRSQEYDVLREELKINRQFVFERPLLIVGVSFATITNLEGALLLHAAALFFLLLLFYNLWFTFNRLSSNSRILGYLRVAHESSDPRKRPGWESALSLHRKWLPENRDRYEEIIAHCKALKFHDTNRFFQGIFWFHITMGGLVVFLALNSVASTMAGPPTVGLSALALVVYLTGIVLSLTKWNPYKIRNPIEVETLVWEEVLRA